MFKIIKLRLWCCFVWDWVSWLQLDLLHAISLYLSLFPPHFISYGFHWFSTATLSNLVLLCFVLLELTRDGIISLWIFQLWSSWWIITKWTWLSWLQFGLSNLIHFIWVCFLLTLSHLGSICSRLQFDNIVFYFLLFDLTRDGIISLWIIKSWSCMGPFRND